MDNANKSAFPVPGDCLANDEGLSKREYFAALAMQGLYAGGSIPDLVKFLEPNAAKHAEVRAAVCKEATNIADALLAELEGIET